jgi:hypothetical protein
MSQVESVEERVAREDLVMFINACFACTGQREFYGGASGQKVSIRFLHLYILGNYRRLYARTLSAGINHFNQGQIVLNLLATGRDTRPADREEENALITATLAALPVQRVYRIFEALRDQRVNNRRTRAVIRSYISTRDQIIFDAVKYRTRVRIAVTHAHLQFDSGAGPEVGHFLFHGWKNQKFETKLFEDYRQAHYSQKAVYRLPYTVAEGLAAKHGIPRDEFLAGIAERMSANEKLRAMKQTRAAGVDLNIDLGRAAITRLAIYIASLSPAERSEREEELHEALNRSAARVIRRTPRKLGRVCAVLDRSHSSSGSSDKRKRPFALALAASYLLRHAADEYRALWTPSLIGSEVSTHPRGQSDIAHPLLEALRFQPDLVVIVSDGYENSPPGAATQLVRAFRRCVPGGEEVSIVHLNPVFDSESYAPKALGPDLPTVGIRSAEDILTMLSFARFAAGTAPLTDLEDYLEARMDRFLQPRSGASS